MEKQQSLQMNDNSQSAGCHTAPATNSLVTGSLCEYLGSALKCNNPVDTEGKYSSHTANPIAEAESNVQLQVFGFPNSCLQSMLLLLALVLVRPWWVGTSTLLLAD